MPKLESKHREHLEVYGEDNDKLAGAGAELSYGQVLERGRESARWRRRGEGSVLETKGSKAGQIVKTLLPSQQAQQQMEENGEPGAGAAGGCTHTPLCLLAQ